MNEAERIANSSLDSLKSQATDNANAMLGNEIQRLDALAARNSSVRRDEIEGMRTRLDETLRALTQLRCVLDAVRVFGIA